MIVISDASAIIALSAIGKLDILRDLFQEVIIPPAVFNEIVIQGVQRPGAEEVKNKHWITVHSAQDNSSVAALNLGKGEKEAIALFLELNADLLLIDEVKARKEAKQLGVTYTGILGVLVEAKRQNLIPMVKSLMDDLRIIAGFRISQPLYEFVLNEVDETSSLET